MEWEGLYYFDKVLPFGLRRAPYLFNKLSYGLEWILQHKCAISYVTHFLDDFLIMEPSLGDPKSLPCKASPQSMLIAFRNLRVPISKEKTQGKRLEFLTLCYIRTAWKPLSQKIKSPV